MQFLFDVFNIPPAMNLPLNVLGIILGFVLLIKSADFFVNASIDIAKRLRIPSMLIGLTIVAMGTSAPELVISASASISGSGDIAIANVVGSNIFNLLFIVGFCALLYPIPVKLKAISKEHWIASGGAVLLLVLIIAFRHTVPRFGSFILLITFIIYMIITVRNALKNRIEEIDTPQNDATPQPSAKPIALNIFILVAGIAVIVFAGNLTVSSAVEIATAIGITERMIALTIVASGTSLPELVTGIIACSKKENEFTLGVIAGSNLFNLFFVLGVAGLIRPLSVESGVIFDLAALTVGNIAFFLFAYTKKRITRFEGSLMMLMYLTYMFFVFWL